MKSFLVALQFLTRIPVRFKEFPTKNQNADSLLYYPLVGLLIGLLLFATNSLLGEASDLLRAGIVLTIWVFITGALHLDGLADSADALVGGIGDKEKTLRIMKDPNCGPVGVVTLVVSLLLKFALIASIALENSAWIILSPILARSSVILSFLTTPYVRPEGLGTTMASLINRKAAYGMLILVALSILIFMGINSLIVFTAMLVTFFGLRKLMLSRIEGMTGDTLGAQVEIIEIVVLLTVALGAF